MSVSFRPNEKEDDNDDDDDDNSVTILEDEQPLGVYTVEEIVDKLGFGLFQFGVIMFAGATWIVEAFELMILAILSVAIKCEWDLSDAEEAMITTVVFFGVMIGSPIWGLMADTIGRKWTMFCINVLTFLFGLLSAFSPNYGFLLFLRGLVGIGVGGAFVGVTYCAEFFPTRNRAFIMVLLEFFWALGAILEASLALVVMTNMDDDVNWRWLLGLSAIPVGLMSFIFPFILESPRYLLQKGDVKKATKILASISSWRGQQLPPGQLVTQEEKERIVAEQSDQSTTNKSSSVQTADHDDTKHQSYGTLSKQDQIEAEVSESIRILQEKTPLLHSSKLPIKSIVKEQIKIYFHWVTLLFKNGWWKTTLLLWLLWALAQVIYYGVILLTTSLFEDDEHCGLTEDNDDNSTCDRLTESDYVAIIWTTAAEFPGLLFVILLLYLMGRKYAMAVEQVFCAICFSLLFICAGKTVLTLILFAIRGFAVGYFQAVYLYTPEVYPTVLRGFGMSLCSSVSRVGAMISPFIPQTILPANENVAIGIYIFVSIVTMIGSLLLPIETKGRPMKDTGTR